uniref:Uncharacterized protein n=1 Tax=Glossina palpalis gambiensis TaxID=67801 RepID=A0A1B0BB56_9MUSC
MNSELKAYYPPFRLWNCVSIQQTSMNNFIVIHKKKRNQDNSTCVMPRHVNFNSKWTYYNLRVFVCGLTPIMHMSCQQNNNNCNCLVVTVVAVDRTVAPIVVNQPAWRIWRRVSKIRCKAYIVIVDIIAAAFILAGIPWAWPGIVVNCLKLGAHEAGIAINGRDFTFQSALRLEFLETFKAK